MFQGRCSTRVSIPACHSCDLSLIPNNNKFNHVLTILIGFKIGLLFLTPIVLTSLLSSFHLTISRPSQYNPY